MFCMAMYDTVVWQRPRSKKLAEERAWELAKGQGRWRLVTINPGVVLGPPMAPRKDSESVSGAKASGH